MLLKPKVNLALTTVLLFLFILSEQTRCADFETVMRS